MCYLYLRWCMKVLPVAAPKMWLQVAYCGLEWNEDHDSELSFWLAHVVPTNVTIPLNVTALDKCHNSARQMSQPTTNVTTLPRQMSQPTTNVTALPRQMSQPTTNVTTLPRQMSQPTTNVTTLPWLPTTNVTTSRQMSVVISLGQAEPLFHWSDVEYYTWSETHNIFIWVF